jgi:mercuric ion transport protein
MSTNNKLLGTGIVSAIAASLCCITPLLALIAGTSGMASSFSWLEPLRPYLIGLTVFVLGFAWYQKLKKPKEIDCECDDEKPKFIQSKTFLAIVTAFAMLMLAFPYFSNIFYPTVEKEMILVDQRNLQSFEFKVEGMTCAACENHIIHEVNKLEGIAGVKASYNKKSASVQFNKTKTSLEEVEKAINSTGYAVVYKEEK